MRLKPKQKEDLARAALQGGLVLSWDCGLGKSLAAFIWSMLRLGWTNASGRTLPNQPVLIVSLGDGYEQFKAEAALLKADLVRLDTHSTLSNLTLNPNNPNPTLNLNPNPDPQSKITLPPAFYYASYTELTLNGVDWRTQLIENDKGEQVKIRTKHSPSMADLLQDSFGAIIVDEGVRIKGMKTIVGEGIRSLRAPNRMVTTATPIKNRLPDVFPLVAWTAGSMEEANARFPYACTIEDQIEFAKNFLVSEVNLTKLLNGNRRTYKKLTAEVCNVHGLWKLFAPNILRRRKADMSDDLQPIIRHIVRVPMGSHQRDVYAYHLAAKYRDKDDNPAPGAKCQALRVASANPCSLLLEKVGEDFEQPPGQPRSQFDYIPKVAATLNIIAQCLERGEQIICGAAFHDALDGLASRLDQAGVPYLKLDGRMSQRRRGKLALQFKEQKIPVGLFSVESMAELHSFPKCSNLVYASYSWAWDRFWQFLSRVHRLNSVAPVNQWSVITDGTIERKLEDSINTKGDSQELVLDGKLLGEHTAEINLAELVKIARDEFNPESETIDELALENDWPSLKERLQSAALSWQPRHTDALLASGEEQPVQPPVITGGRASPCSSRPPVLHGSHARAASVLTLRDILRPRLLKAA